MSDVQDGPAEVRTIGIIVDVKQRRPACPLLQAAMGGDSHIVTAVLDSRDWLVFPTRDMYMVRGTLDQWKGFAEELNRRRNGPAL